MKKIILAFSAFVLMAINAQAQAPEAFKYQAVIRDAGNTIVNNQAVGMQLVILQGSPSGTAVYTEAFSTTSNAYGLVNLEIGTGTTTDDFSAIDWSNGPYFIETSIDLTGGTSYNLMGTSQLVSVPYALHATTAESALVDNVDDADSDPSNELNTGLVLNGTSLELTDAGGTLSQDLDGTFATDAEVAAAAAAITENDPIYMASPAAGIASGDITNWNSAYAWGDHSTAGYLTTEVDGDATNELQTLSIVGNDITISSGNTVALPADNDWVVSGVDMNSMNTGNVGIGTTTPDNKLDVNGKISLTESVGDEMVIINSDVWVHGSGSQDFGTGGAHFIMASQETDYESAGVYGDGNVLTLWSPGDANNGQPSALIYVCDEDRFDGAVDNNPHNNNSIYAYLNTAGNWVAASDMNRKEDIQPLENSLEKILAINGYTYKFKLVEAEIAKGDVAPESIGVLAQEVKTVIPEVVEVAEDGSHYVSYIEFIPILIEATKEQQEIIDEQQEVAQEQQEIVEAQNELIEQQKAEILALKLKMLELDKRLKALENK